MVCRLSFRQRLVGCRQRKNVPGTPENLHVRPRSGQGGFEMDVTNSSTIGGSLQISTDVIAKIAKLATLEIEGVK